MQTSSISITRGPVPRQRKQAERLSRVPLPELWKRWQAAFQECIRVGRLIDARDESDVLCPSDLKRADKEAWRQIRAIDGAIKGATARTIDDVEAKLQWLAQLTEAFDPPEGYIRRLARDVAKIVEKHDGH